MKPLQIALLVVAGAAGGAIIMKLSEHPAQQAAPAVSQSTQTTPEVQAPPPLVADANPEPVAEPEPSPVHRAATRPKAAHPKPVKPQSVKHNPAPQSQPVEVAQNTPPPDPVAAPAPDPERVAPPPPAPAPAAQPVNVAPPPPPPPPPRQVTLTAGTYIPVRLLDSLTTERNNPGDTFTANLDSPLVVDGLVIAERHARVEGRVVSSDKGGKVKGSAVLSIEITRIHLSDGQTIDVHSDAFTKHAEETHSTDAAKVGGGAAIGAIIGAIAGGGKGAAIGAGAGGGIGAGDVLLTRGKPVTLASETRITFRLNQPLTVTEKRQ